MGGDRPPFSPQNTLDLDRVLTTIHVFILGQNLWKTCGKTPINLWKVCGKLPCLLWIKLIVHLILWKTTPLFPQVFPQGRSPSKPYRTRLLKSFPQFPQALLLLLIFKF